MVKIVIHFHFAIIFYFCQLIFLFPIKTKQLLAAAENNQLISDSAKTVYPGDSLREDGMTLLLYTPNNNYPTNALSKVSRRSFNAGMVNDPLGLIEGRVAGTSINKAGSDPNGHFDARIRGMYNIYGSNFPLIIIDGVYDAQLENIDPNDVESFEVIRDVAATAIYGIRGSNGVIVIKTKKGKSGKAEVDYNVYFNIEKAIRRPDNMSTDEFESFSFKMNVTDNRFGASTNWYDEILQTGLSQVHNLSVSGGTDKSNYYASINFRDVAGVLKGTGINRLNARLNLEQKALKDRLTIGLNVSATQNKAELGHPEAFKYAAAYNPTAPIKSDDQEFEQYDGYFQQILFDNYNPVAIIEQNEHNSINTSLNLSINGSYKILQDLYIKLLYASQSSTENTNRYSSKYSFWQGQNRNGYAYKQTDQSGFQLFQPSVQWQPHISSSQIKIEAGYAYQTYSTEGLGANGGNFLTDAFAYNRLGAAKDFQDGLGEVTSFKHTNKFVGFYGKVDYNLKETYFISLVGRYDGSSRFGDNEKYRFFPGISIGVDLANIFSWSSINLLKTRIGYGQSGQDFHDNYLSQDIWKPTGITYYNGIYIDSYNLINVSNPDLKSPIKSEFNFGIDFSILNGVLTGSFDFYSNKTTDLLVDYRVDPRVYGIWNVWDNGGELKNKGWEMSLFAQMFQNTSVTYHAGLIFSRYLKTSYGSLSDPARGLEFEERWYGSVSFGCCSGPIKMAENSGVGEYWGLEFIRFTDDGEWEYKDFNRDGSPGFNDRVKIGDGLPDFELGWFNDIRYKNWDVQLFFKGAFGYQLLNEYRYRYENPNLISSYNVSRKTVDMKSENGKYVGWGSEYSTYFAEKGNYLKLANFSVGYNFNLRASSALQKLRLFLMGQNLIVITNYSGSDPEVRYRTDHHGGKGNLTPGINAAADWLMTRSFAIGLNFKF